MLQKSGSRCIAIRHKARLAPANDSVAVILCFLFPLLFASASKVNAQVEQVDVWSVPWTIIGDSTLRLHRDSKFVETGKIFEANTNSPIAGALVSADFLKHYDYSDQNGNNYVLELPPGTCRVKVKQLGMLPAYFRIKVFSNGQLNVEMHEGVVQLTEVLITSRPIDSNVKQSLPGLTKMDLQEIKTLPTLMGEVDIVKSLQLMPGATSVGKDRRESMFAAEGLTRTSSS